MAEPTAVRVYSGQNLTIATHLKHVLEMNGIPCEVRGEYRGAGLGEIPVTEAWPELWILDETDRKRAALLIADSFGPVESTLTDWECPHCHESVEGQFSECWNCGATYRGPQDA